MHNLKTKLQFEGSDVEFTKSIFRLQILSDLLSKELNANYPRLNINYRKELMTTMDRIGDAELKNDLQPVISFV